MNTKRKIVRNTAEEEVVIRNQAAHDEDNPESTTAELSRMRPFGEVMARRMGRPPIENPKEQVSVRYDADVIAAFRATGEGWQTRMNAALRVYLKEHPLTGTV